MSLGIAVLRVDRVDQSLENIEAWVSRRRGLVVGDSHGVATAGLRLLQCPGDRGEQDRDRFAVVWICRQTGADRDRQPLRRLELEAEVGEPGPDAIDRRFELADGLGGG